MRLRYVLIAAVAFILQDPATEGKRWWSHVEFLADDALEGRNVGTPGFEKAAAYVEGQFKDDRAEAGGDVRLPPAGEVRIAHAASRSSRRSRWSGTGRRSR